jgi:hypothetical protein
MTEEFRGTLDLLSQHQAELDELLAGCSTRRPRDEGIPAILIVDDFTRPEKPLMTPAPGDAELGRLYADLSLALAILVESKGGDPMYPSICPAMSAIAEWEFGHGPFNAWKREAKP